MCKKEIEKLQALEGAQEELWALERPHQEYSSMELRMEADIKDFLLKMEHMGPPLL